MTVNDTIYDALTVNDTIYDALTVNDTNYDAMTVNDIIYDALTVNDTIYDALTVNDTFYDAVLLLLARSNFDHYARECEFGILKKGKRTRNIVRLCFCLNEECPKLLSSLGIDHRRRKTIPLWNSPGKKFFRASLYVWYIQYWALCDGLVDFKL